MPTLVEDLIASGLDKETAEKVAAAPAAKTLDNWRQNGLRQDEFSRKMNLLTDEQKVSKQRIDEEAARLATEKARVAETISESNKAREAAEVRLATAVAKSRTASADFGIDLTKDIFGDIATPGVPVVPAAPEKPTTSDTSEERMRTLEELFHQVPKLNVELQQIALDHNKLFPATPLDLKKVWDESVRLRREPTYVWDQLYGATAERQKQEAERYRAEGRAEQKTADELEMSRKLAAAHGNPAPTSSSFFDAVRRGNEKRNPTPNPVADRARNSGDRAAIAAAAFSSGKYRQAGSAPAA